MGCGSSTASDVNATGKGGSNTTTKPAVATKSVADKIKEIDAQKKNATFLFHGPVEKAAQSILITIDDAPISGEHMSDHHIEYCVLANVDIETHSNECSDNLIQLVQNAAWMGLHGVDVIKALEGRGRRNRDEDFVPFVKAEKLSGTSVRFHVGLKGQPNRQIQEMRKVCDMFAIKGFSAFLEMGYSISDLVSRASTISPYGVLNVRASVNLFKSALALQSNEELADTAKKIESEFLARCIKAFEEEDEDTTIRKYVNRFSAADKAKKLAALREASSALKDFSNGSFAFNLDLTHAKDIPAMMPFRDLSATIDLGTTPLATAVHLLKVMNVHGSDMVNQISPIVAAVPHFLEVFDSLVQRDVKAVTGLHLSSGNTSADKPLSLHVALEKFDIASVTALVKKMAEVVGEKLQGKSAFSVSQSMVDKMLAQPLDAKYRDSFESSASELTRESTQKDILTSWFDYRRKLIREMVRVEENKGTDEKKYDSILQGDDFKESREDMQDAASRTVVMQFCLDELIPALKGMSDEEAMTALAKTKIDEFFARKTHVVQLTRPAKEAGSKVTPSSAKYEPTDVAKKLQELTDDKKNFSCTFNGPVKKTEHGVYVSVDQKVVSSSFLGTKEHLGFVTFDIKAKSADSCDKLISLWSNAAWCAIHASRRQFSSGGPGPFMKTEKMPGDIVRFHMGFTGSSSESPIQEMLEASKTVIPDGFAAGAKVGYSIEGLIDSLDKATVSSVLNVELACDLTKVPKEAVVGFAGMAKANATETFKAGEESAAFDKLIAGDLSHSIDFSKLVQKGLKFTSEESPFPVNVQAVPLISLIDLARRLMGNKGAFAASKMIPHFVAVLNSLVLRDVVSINGIHVTSSNKKNVAPTALHMEFLHLDFSILTKLLMKMHDILGGAIPVTVPALPVTDKYIKSLAQKNRLQTLDAIMEAILKMRRMSDRFSAVEIRSEVIEMWVETNHKLIELQMDVEKEQRANKSAEVDVKTMDEYAQQNFAKKVQEVEVAKYFLQLDSKLKHVRSSSMFTELLVNEMEVIRTESAGLKKAAAAAVTAAASAKKTEEK